MALQPTFGDGADKATTGRKVEMLGGRMLLERQRSALFATPEQLLLALVLAYGPCRSQELHFAVL